LQSKEAPLRIQSKNVIMRKFILITILFSSVLFTLNSCKDQQNKSAQKVENAASNDLLLVKYHADWCGSCKALTPMLKELNGKLSGKKVKYVELNFTDKETTALARSQATNLGLSGFLTEKQKTGYVAIIDAKTKKELGKLTKTQSVSEMYGQVTGHL